MATPSLPNDVILQIHAAAISAGLASSQTALLSGLDARLVAGLPHEGPPGERLLATLHALNQARLTNGSIPLRTWLTNAVAIAGGKVETNVFEQAIAALEQAITALRDAASSSGVNTALGPPEPAAAPERKKLFVSYSHADREWLDRLRVHLKPLERAGKIDFWDDSRIELGAKWHQEIKNALEGASLAVLLVSADFLASDFIAGEELPKLLQAEAGRGLRIIPVIVSPCMFTTTPILREYQAANDPRRPLSALSKHEQDEVFVRVAQTIAKG
jgi:hypothetical protein